MEKHLHQELLDAISPALGMASEKCTVHSQKTADALCPECGKLYCMRCMAFDQESETLVWGRCRANLINRVGRSMLSRIARLPFVYVMLLASLTFAAYASGLGNPGIDEMQKADSDKPWFQNRAGKLWVQQASRTKKRVEQLENGNAPQEELLSWAKLTHSAFANAHKCWEGKEPEIDLAIGKALALAETGQKRSAYHALLNLDREMFPDHPARLAYLYHRGKAALQCGCRKEAVKDWTRALKMAEPSSSYTSPWLMLNRINDVFSVKNMEGVILQWIRQSCGTLMGAHDIRENIFNRIRENGMEAEFPRNQIPCPAQSNVVEEREPTVPGPVISWRLHKD